MKFLIIYQFFRGRISSEGNIMAVGKNIKWGGGKETKFWKENQD